MTIKYNNSRLGTRIGKISMKDIIWTVGKIWLWTVDLDISIVLMLKFLVLLIALLLYKWIRQRPFFFKEISDEVF